MLLVSYIIPHVFMVANNVAERRRPVYVAADVHGCSKHECCQFPINNVFLF